MSHLTRVAVPLLPHRPPNVMQPVSGPTPHHTWLPSSFFYFHFWLGKFNEKWFFSLNHFLIHIQSFSPNYSFSIRNENNLNCEAITFSSAQLQSSYERKMQHICFSESGWWRLVRLPAAAWPLSAFSLCADLWLRLCPDPGTTQSTQLSHKVRRSWGGGRVKERINVYANGNYFL